MKLLAFDSWTQGSAHYARLMPAIARRNIDFLLVHLGSWGSETGRPSQEVIEGFIARDINYYGGRSIEKVLDIEKPDAVIFLSTQTFSHRACLNYCRIKKIPTLHLYHGLVNVQVTTGSGSYKRDPIGHAKFVLARVGKQFTKVLPAYCGSLIKSRATMKDWIRLFSDIVNLVTGSSKFIAASDAITDWCAVYVNADVEHAVRVYGFDRDKVIVVGNPDIIKFGMMDSDLGYSLRQPIKESRQVIYIETGLVPLALSFANNAEFVAHLLSLNVVLQAAGYSMSIKPHPAVDSTDLKCRLVGSDIPIISNDEFLERVRGSAACVVETTSLAMVPALMATPLLYANFGRLADLKFGHVLETYPRSEFLTDLRNVITSIEKLNLKPSNDAEILIWIAENSGPLPAVDMPERVVALLEKLMVRH